MRTLIKEADPDVVEELKWVKPTNPGTPVWSHDGIICTGEPYKSVVKLTFAKGASLKDRAGLFNSGLDGKVRRAIDIRQREDVDEAAFKALVRQAVALNTSGKRIPNCSLMYGHCSRRVKTDRRDVAALAPACRHRIDRCAHRRSSRQRVVQWPLNVRRARLNLGGARDHSLARLSDCRWRDGHVCDPTCRVGAPGVSE